MTNRTQNTDFTPATNQHSAPDGEEALRLNRLIEELQPALRSLLPGHKAFFLAVLHQLDGAGVLHSASAQQHRFVPMSLTRTGTDAISHLNQDGSFNESEVSTMALCCLLYEYGCLYMASQKAGSSNGQLLSNLAPITQEDLISGKEYWHSPSIQPYAHPRTLLLIGPILSMIELSDPELVRQLRYILDAASRGPHQAECNRPQLSESLWEVRDEQMRDEVSTAMGRVFIKARALSEVPSSTDLLRLTYVPARGRASDSVCQRHASHAPRPAGKEAPVTMDLFSDLLDDPSSDASRREPGANLAAHGSPTQSPTPFRPGQKATRPPAPSLQWAAGMLDGDGCITIIRQTYKKRKSALRLLVTVTQNCRQTLEHFRDSINVEAPIYAIKRRAQHNKQIYVINYGGAKARKVIEVLNGHLFRKRIEAQVAIDFCEAGQSSRSFGSRGVPPQIQAIREACFHKMRALK